MHFEELNVMTKDKNLVTDYIEKKLIEKNISYVKLNYLEYTEFHFLNNIYRLVFVGLDYEFIGKYDVINRIINSMDEKYFKLKQPMSDIFSEPNKEKTGYKKYTKKLDLFNKGKINSKGYQTKGYFRK